MLLIAPQNAQALVNINTASKEELIEGIVGVGPSIAQNIIDYRADNGPFTSVDELINVRLIGFKTLEDIRPQVTIGEVSQTLAQNGGQTEAQTVSSSNTSPSSSSGGGGSKPPSSITARIVGPTTAVAGADAWFEAEVMAGGSRVRSGNFEWSFGDGADGRGERAFHAFKHPGKYAVVLNVSAHGLAATARLVVEVAPMTLTLAAHPDGSFSIANAASREADIGLWSILSGTERFVFPRGTIILPGETVRLSPERTGLTAHAGTLLLFSNGSVATAAGLPDAAIEQTKAPPAAGAAGGGTSAVRAAFAPSGFEPEEESVLQPKVTLLAAAGNVPAPWGYGLGLAALIALGVAGALYAQRAGTPPPETARAALLADEFEIEEQQR